MAAVKADLPNDLKRRAFAAFARRDLKFAAWLRVQLEAWLELEETPYERLACHETSQQECWTVGAHEPPRA